MLFTVSTAFAKAATNPAATIISKIMNAIVLPVVEGFFIFTVLIFIWGVFGLMKSGDDPDKRKEGQKHILYGVIGIFIMISAYGIIQVIANTLGVTVPTSL